MIRNLKALGLALVAVFALSAVAASVASAQEQGTLTSTGPVTLTAEETGAVVKANALTAFGLAVVCPGTKYTGHKVITKHETTTIPKPEHKSLPSGSKDVTLTPHYNQPKCRVDGLEWPATVDMNGCDYVGHIGVTTPVKEANTYGITFDLVCPAGKEITLTIWTPGEVHSVDPAPSNAICIVHFGETGNQGLAGAHVTDTTNGHIDITGTVEGVDATRTASKHVPILCPETTINNGKLDIDITVKGHNDLKEPTTIGISHP